MRSALIVLVLMLVAGFSGAGAGRPAADAALTIPAWSAYARPDRAALKRDRQERIVEFTGDLSFYFRAEREGSFVLEVELAPPAAVDADEAPELRVEFAEGNGSRVTLSTLERNGDGLLVSRALKVRGPGYQRIALLRADVEGDPAPVRLTWPLVSVTLRGPAIEGATATTIERRNAASIHLGYPRPLGAEGRERDDVEWFHCRVTPKDDPLWTYYMATGWHRGYFGMQVNSETERRIIFSVWDSGDEAIDRAKVAAEDMVQLVAKGEDVVASGFGNEGTGGHSHLVFPWKLGDSIDFLVRAEPEGAHTTYTGWFRVAERSTGTLSKEDRAWRLVASFKAPKDGRYLGGLYSFNENFWGANGDVRRVCEFDAQWLRTADGAWHEVSDARFTTDGHGKPDAQTGHPGRLDRSAGVRGRALYLAHGGFVDDRAPGAVTEPGQMVRREPRGGRPPLTDAQLGALPLNSK